MIFGKCASTIAILIHFYRFCNGASYDDIIGIEYKTNPAPDGHRCGICPTYFQKICAFNFQTNSTYIFDNHCVMDLYNCIHGTVFVQLKRYENCLYIGNFAYVHGIKREDSDYGEDHIGIIDTKKNPDFVK
ncbi:uncharacterized protein LOC123699872 [Colias croceus]|uniref:uncharacterized protein LOC123699872 n=1 Tax=Colias crocea TaxID=72248 RepID=UPI001E27F566|nr:uncharacterized protein LOC123699872 [Colias croceus]